jgi:heme A synthase
MTVGSTKAGAALRPVRQPARWLLGVALALAGLGLAGGASRSELVVLANQAGGFVLLALAWVIVRRLRGDAAPPAAAVRWLTLLALVWLVQAGLGALSGAGKLAAALLHLVSALLVLPLALGSGAQALRLGMVREGRALLGLVGLQAVAGGCAVAFGAPPPLVLVHNAGAALGFALIAGLADAARTRVPPVGS